MAKDSKGSQFRLGFLTAIHVAERGYVGGLLVTNHYARPLEFQCTTPVQPNRTQEILYGPTLVPYVLSELIGRTLVEKISVKPELVLVDRDDLLSLGDQIDIPVALVFGEAERAENRESRGEGSGSKTSSRQAVRISLGRNTLCLHGAGQADRASIEEHRELIPETADLLEPFQRVREALQETTAPVRARAVPA